MRSLRLLLLLSLGAMLHAGPKVSSPPPFDSKTFVSKPLVPVTVPKASQQQPGKNGSTKTAALLAAALPRPVDMRLLVITVDGTEPSYQAIVTFLGQIGVPFQTVFARTQTLPVLSDAVKGYYQGIVLVTGNLGLCDPTCRSALSQADWDRLDLYAVNFGVRTVSYYTFPEARYGMSYAGVVQPTSAAPQFAQFTSAATDVFPHLNRTNPMKLTDAYTYLGAVFPVTGATTVPVLQIGGAIVGAVFNDADGSEALALTMDNNPNLLHSLAFNYGLVRWVTRGKFLGSRKIYLSPQIDDLFLANDQFLRTVPACVPVGFSVDPTFDPDDQCPALKISAADLTGLANWQANVRANSQTTNFRTAFAFNGFGYTTAGGGGGAQDPLRREALRLGSTFWYVNHTWDHENLDCYNPVPNSSICRPATNSESWNEIRQNEASARSIGLPVDWPAMVTPNISGLNNPQFMRAAKDWGIKWVVTDASRPEGAPPSPNAGILNQHQPTILMIPRRANNIFYNVTTPTLGAVGSLPDEFNYFYGPSGIFRIGGPGGPPFFNSVQTYQQILDFESDGLLKNMLRYELYPVMFHQGNVWRYNGLNSLYSDLIDLTLQKFRALSSLPVLSLTQSQIGPPVKDRMDYNVSGVTATWTPGVGITVRAVNKAVIPVTGACAQGCENYGGDSLSRITVNAGQTLTIPAP